MNAERRTLEWAGDSKDVLRTFPTPVRWTFGRALYKAEISKQYGAASRLAGRLRGIVEVADDHRGDTYRLYYTLKCPDRIYVLYCHKKKSKRGVR